MLYKTLCGSLLMCVMSCAISQEEQQETENTKRPSWSEGLPERQKAASLNKPEFKPDMDDSIELDMSEFGLKPKAKAEIEIGLPINDGIAADKGEQNSAEIVTTEAEQQAPVVEPPVEQIPQTITEEQPVVADTSVDTNNIDDATQDVPPVEDEITAAIADSSENTVDDTTQNSAAEIATETDVVDEEVTIPVEQSIAAVEPPPSSQELDVIEAAAEKQNEYQWSITTQKPVDYPPKAAMENLEGWVDVEVTINPAGEVISASAVGYSRKGRVFGKNAIRSVKQWEFAPPSEQGIDSNVTRVYKIEFQL